MNTSSATPHTATLPSASPRVWSSNPAVSLLIYGDKFNGSNYIQIDGRAEVIDHPDAMPIVLDWHQKIRGEPKSWDEIKQKTLAEGRIAIRLTVEKCGPQSSSHG